MPNHGYGDRRGERKEHDGGRHHDDRRHARKKDREVEVVGEKRSTRTREHAGGHQGQGRGSSEQGRGSSEQGRGHGGQEKAPKVQPRSVRGGVGPFDGNSSQHDDSGYGQQMPSYEDPYYGGYGRGGWFGVPHQGHFMDTPGFGRGMARHPFNSTPDFGRGWGSPLHRGRGGWRGRGRGGSEAPKKGDSQGSGTANEVLAKRIKELEEENADLKEKLQNDTPKKKTVTELENIKEKNKQLTNRVQTMEELVDEKNHELAKLANIEETIEEFNLFKGNEEDILKECSARVKKHLKIVIENKMSQDDLQSCLRVLLSRLDKVHVWGCMVKMVEEADSMNVRDKIIEMLGGRGEDKNDINGGLEDSDSAPSSDPEEEPEKGEKSLEPKKLSFEVAETASPESEAIPAKVLDSTTKKKLLKNKENAKVMRTRKFKENAEKFAKEEMETGDKSITDCYDNLLFSLTNIHPGQAEGSSPIIKKRKAEQHGPKDENGPKTNKAKVDEVKTSSLGGISIRVEGEETFSMKDLIKKVEEGGTRMLDQNTGDLIKKIPCGFYPTCTKTLYKKAMVRGGLLFEPKGHRKEGKMVYVCLDHEMEIEAGRVETTSNEGNEEDEKLDELEASVLAEEEELNDSLNEKAVEKKENDEGVENEDLLSQSVFQQ